MVWCCVTLHCIVWYGTGRYSTVWWRKIERGGVRGEGGKRKGVRGGEGRIRDTEGTSIGATNNYGIGGEGVERGERRGREQECGGRKGEEEKRNVGRSVSGGGGERGEGGRAPRVVNIRHELIDLLTAVIGNVFGQCLVFRWEVENFQGAQHLGSAVVGCVV